MRPCARKAVVIGAARGDNEWKEYLAENTSPKHGNHRCEGK